MKAFIYKYHLAIFFSLFLVSRILIYSAGIHLDYNALFRYWQYLDISTLKDNLISGVWFNHTQPPIFNLILGAVLKISGNMSVFIFQILLWILSFLNTLLLFKALNKIDEKNIIAFLISCLYMFSPATIIFEYELFYTTFISFLLLLAVNCLFSIDKKITWLNLTIFSVCIIIICLTRSFYHLIFLLLIMLSLFIFLHKRKRKGIIILVTCLSTILVSGWYIKNYILFSRFSTSSWIGMNVARNVFHDADTSKLKGISKVEPFSPVSKYQDFINFEELKKYKGLNDKDLFEELKTGGHQNMNHVAFLSISEKYLEESKVYLFKYPFLYFRNVIQSAIMFFAPATRYPTTEYQTLKMRNYDIIYSFNLTHFANNRNERRIALVISALPKFFIYLLTFIYLLRLCFKKEKLPLIIIFGILVIIYNFSLGSLLEHYENMRFRYETEPIFLILLFYSFCHYRKRNLTK